MILISTGGMEQPWQAYKVTVEPTECRYEATSSTTRRHYGLARFLTPWALDTTQVGKWCCWGGPGQVYCTLRWCPISLQILRNFSRYLARYQQLSGTQQDYRADSLLTGYGSNVSKFKNRIRMWPSKIGSCTIFP